ncbi:cell division control protein 42 homolog [Arctopsyche grandis]|uniref:cell division control protein 42 homolog n=1 Tax=Arctopsyche grandis TaxID=121162 RepID=UPI00406D73DC
MTNIVIKCVVVGDGAVGKTSLLISYTSDEFPEYCSPTVFDSYTMQVDFKKDTYNLGLFDTAGNEGYERIRAVMYPSTDVFLICFSVVYPDSLENVKEVWVPEILNFNKDIPFLLVGTRIDERNDPKIINKLAERRQKVIEPEQGKRVAKELKAVNYVECSALTKEGLKNVFNQAIQATLVKPKVSQRCRCSIM